MLVMDDDGDEEDEEELPSDAVRSSPSYYTALRSLR